MSVQNNTFITIKEAYQKNKNGLPEHFIRRRISKLSEKQKKKYTEKIRMFGRTYIILHPDLTTDWDRIRAVSYKSSVKQVPKDQKINLLISVTADKYSDLETIGNSFPSSKPMFFSIVKGKDYCTIHIATSETFESVKSYVESFPFDKNISCRKISKVTLPYYCALKQGTVTIRNIDPKLFKIKYL